MKILSQFKRNHSSKKVQHEAPKPRLDPKKSDYYESSFLGGEQWLDSSGKRDFLGDLAEQGGRVTFRRRVPDDSRPQNKLVRIGKSLAVGLFSTVVTTTALSPVAGIAGMFLAAAIGVPAFAVAGTALAGVGIASGVMSFQENYSEDKFKTKLADTKGTLSWSRDKNDLMFTPEGAKKAVEIPQEEWYVSSGGD